MDHRLLKGKKSKPRILYLDKLLFTHEDKSKFDPDSNSLQCDALQIA